MALKGRGMDSKEYFGAVAAGWDRMREGFFTAALRDKVIAASGASAGMTVADIGAGSGFLTEGLLATGAKVIAVDQSPQMLSVLRAKYPAVDARLGEADTLPVENGTVDIAMANMYLHHVERPEIAIKEMARILKPGGTLAISDLDSHNHEFLRVEHHDRWMGFHRADVARWLEEAGLSQIRVDCAEETCRSQAQSGAAKAEISIFIAAGRKP